MNYFCILVAGGRGNRMGGGVPKQFLVLAGKPVLMHSISAFHQAEADIQILVVLPEGLQGTWIELCAKYHFTESHTLVTGGETRYQSVKNGLAAIEGQGLVAVHDGVRPLISPDTIRHLFTEASDHSNAIPVVSPKDSLRWIDDRGSRVIDRSRIKLIQTPQVFELNKLKSAYVLEYEEAFTDDATVWEKAGNKVYLAEGQEDNLKITTPADLIIAEALLVRRRQGEVNRLNDRHKGTL